MVIYMEEESLPGMMVGYLKVTGQIMSCMVKAFLLGPMVVITKAAIKMTGSMDSVSSPSPTGAGMKATGKMVNNMGEGSSSQQMAKPKKEHGIVASLLNGSVVSEHRG